MKTDKLEAGDIIIADGGFTCMEAGPKTVRRNLSKGLWVCCAKGEHYLNDDEPGFTPLQVGHS